MKMKRIMALVLALTLCLGLAACGGESNGDDGVKLAADEAMYEVSVVDGMGQPYTAGVIARFLQNGQQVSMQVVNDQGVAQKALKKGEYTVELQFTDKNAAYYYDQTDLKVTADKPALQIMLYAAISGEGHSLFAYSMKAQEKVDCTAHSVDVGCTYVEMTAGERNYFLFTPTQSGTYQVSLKQGEGAVGYYGAPHFVQDYSAVDVIDNKVSISVRPDSIGEGGTTSALVLGVDAVSESAILSVERIGDHEHSITDEPWTPYQTTHTPAPYTLPAGQKLTYVDIKGKTEDYQLVMGEDGYYHLGTADGPLMYINLGKDAPNLSLKIMIQGDGVAGGAPLRRYFYDENNEFVKKEDYTDIMVSYIENADENTGVYPLTADLEYMIKNAGFGWWDSTHPNYIFEGCNPDLGWLFACCYAK